MFELLIARGAEGKLVAPRSEAEKIGQLRPQLITWNGHSFDLPVLRYRAMVNRISAAGLHVRQYFHRDTDDALDLCDILGSYARGAKAKLDEVSKILGLTGKPEGIDGSKVGEMVAVGQIDEVARYCKSDVLNTFPVWLVYESFRGAITEAQLEWSEAQIRDFVAKRKSGNPHLLAAVGMATNFPRQGCGLSETVERWEDAVDACGVNVMQYAKTISLSAIVCLSLLSQEATATPFWSVYWINEPQPCIGVTGGLGGPVVSSYYEHCVFEGTTVSICRNTKPNRGPWEEGQAITIVGYSLNMILSSPTSPGTAVVGQYGGKGADVFGETSGVGSNSRTIFFPPGLGLSQMAGAEDAHFDVYANCKEGTFQVLVSIYYTSP